MFLKVSERFQGSLSEAFLKRFCVNSSVCFCFWLRIKDKLLTGLNTLSLSAGSQRLSDGEFSDYDCEDGIGVISGEDVLFQVLITFLITETCDLIN